MSINQTDPEQSLQIHMRKLDFKDPEAACQALDEGLQIQWEEDKGADLKYSKQS